MALSPKKPDDRQERLVEAAMAVLQATPKKELKITLLNKGLFYLDLLTLRDSGETATGAAYLALQQGPILAKYEKRLIAPLVARGLAVQEVAGMAKPVRVTTALAAYQHLSEETQKTAADIGREVAKLTSAQASEFSHDNPAWKVAFEEGLGSGHQPKLIDMVLAMQQLDDEPEDRDPWMDASPDQALLRAFQEAAEQL
jgi:hypothetical protein